MKKPLPFAEHDAIGAELQAMRDRLLSLSGMLANTYGKTKRPGRLAERAQKAVDALRCELDAQLCRDHPGEFNPRVYYRGRASS